MDAFQTHLCIVSGQPIPNLAAALDSRLRPQRVVLLTSSEMGDRAARLESVLARHGIKACRWPLADRLNLARVRQDVETCLRQFGEEGAVLNATGGQKPMSIAAYDVFRTRGLPVFYVETDNSLTWLHPQEERGFELESRLMLGDYLGAYSYGETSRDSGKGYQNDALALHLTNLAGISSRGLATLNWVASEAREGLKSVRLTPGQLAMNGIRRLFRNLSQQDVLLFDDRTGIIHFPDEPRRAFANGGWLEQHVATILTAHRDAWGIADLASNVQVRTDAGNPPVPNELDVAFLARNHLYIVECKTRQPRGDDGETDELTQMLYKLDSIRKIGGLVARPMLVSWYIARPWHKERAKLSDIVLVSGSALHNLPQHLEAWLRTPPQAR